MKKFSKIIAVYLAFLTTFAVNVACAKDSKEILMVKKHSFADCSDYTIEEVLNTYLEKPKWKLIVDENGFKYVNVSGITTSGKPVNVLMQFWVRKDEFGFQAIEVNKEAVSPLFISSVIEAMCKTAKIKKEATDSVRISKISIIPAEPLNDSRDNKKYKTIKIGEQIWMAENLNYMASNSKCYGNANSNCDKYGRLYNWNEAMKVCPSGWHLPTKTDLDRLIATAGGENKAGKYLKAASGWSGGNGEDSFGFSALPGGSGDSDGSFYNAGRIGYWWSASESNSNYAYNRNMYYNYEGAHWDDDGKSLLYSVRCVKD